MKNKVISNPLLKSLLDTLQNEDKTATLLTINSLLDEMQGKIEGLVKTIEESSKKTNSNSYKQDKK